MMMASAIAQAPAQVLMLIIIYTTTSLALRPAPLLSLLNFTQESVFAQTPAILPHNFFTQTDLA
jgi:hypothetical protein